MRYFPLFVRMADRTVVIAGGDEQAAQKLRLMLKTEARVVLMAPSLEPELLEAVRAGRAEHVAAVVDRDALTGAQLLFCATGCAGADAAIAALGTAAGALVNVVDRPDWCEAITPAIVDRDPLVVAIGTEGAAPVLARRVKTALEQMLAPGLGEAVAWAGSLRAQVAQRLAAPKRRAFWAWFWSGALETRLRQGDRAGAEAAVARALEAGPPPAVGAVALVGAGPGSADLITLRGVQRLQEADVIFYDRLVDPAVLELARRDAERVFVGKAPGEGCADAPEPWSQARINRVLVAAAKEGRRVVRLKSGDPGVFGRASEEIEALAEAGFDVEIVPGVTSASAAAAEIGAPLTDRAAGRALVLASGHPAAGEPPMDWGALAAVEATLAVYMGVRRAGEVAAGLIAGGADPASRVAVVERAGAPDARRLETTLAGLEATVRAQGVTNPAMLLIYPPLRASAEAGAPLAAVG